MIALAPSPFEVWAAREGYNIVPAVSPYPLRQYADRDTQAAYKAWMAGAANVAGVATESTSETGVSREKLLSIAV